MTLSPAESARYARHLVLKGVGGAGQQKISRSRVLVVGAGGLGSPVIAYLAAAGVGTLGVADPDTVSVSNLQRQILYGEANGGQPKTAGAEAFVGRINPHVRFVAYPVGVDPEIAAEIVAGYNLVIEGTDSFETKRAVADACARARVPLVMGALGQFDGSLTVLMPYAGANPSFADLYPETPGPEDSPPCELAGVLNVLPGIVGTMMANEALKLIAGYGQPLVGKLLVYSARSGETTILRYGRAAKEV
ncbi:HesA/MoeB/ThiF family protein [Pelagibacterium limicola]|uniref:HesA/MoeB/ThiF family protein n=1 Tax=Pelagibacterium limicola TaxID=2791022 RepID=UPI0018AFA275|nr:HesA/MoeB/ThiF family protein [Pelagibacterium limicola]